MRRDGFAAAVLLVAVGFAGAAPPVDRDTKVRNDRELFRNAPGWVYNDLPGGLKKAKSEGKPALVILRCVPCEGCSEFDDQVARRHPLIKELMDRFVCIRIVQTNGLDLATFQHDYDMSFAAYFMNADGTIYGRFGTRSNRKQPELNITTEGFREALEKALAIHGDYPTWKDALAKKRGPEPAVASPEKFPSLAGRYREQLDYDGKVAQSCIHCHMVGEAARRYHRDRKQPIPEQLLYPYPMPDVLGLSLDAQKAATVGQVRPDSPAAKAGVRVGDELVTLDGQPLLSIADVQWVLHQVKGPATLKAELRRDSKTLPVSMSLEPGWRQGDISWRPSTWDLRRMATGGMVLESMTAEELQKAGLDANTLALRVEHVGQYNDHAVAMRAGIRKGDIVVGFDGLDTPMTETGLIAHVLQNRMPGTTVPVTVLRGGKRQQFQLRMQ